MLIPALVAVHSELTSWRRDLHAHPELAFGEHRTARFIAERLRSWGIRVTECVGSTGVVGTLTVGGSTRAVGLRADMDALPMDELNTFAHTSGVPGCMHGCGHDGHTTMLLAAARYLANTQLFNGTVHFIFQPAEEANPKGSGAKAMIEDGLFERFPMDSVFALHNKPGVPVGVFSVRSGPVLASMDIFDLTVMGKGTHGAMPHTGIDSIVVASHIVSALQSVVSRTLDPMFAAVLSVTSFQAGSTYNVLPEAALIKGSVRSFSGSVQRHVRQQLETIARQVAAAFGATVTIDFRQVAPATINDVEQARFAAAIAMSVVGDGCVMTDTDALKRMGSEDFAYMLEQRPGAYVFLGSGDGPDVCMVHEPRYDFNDDILPIGASYFARIAEAKLAP